MAVRHPVWSPDGQYIVFKSDGGDLSPGLVLFAQAWYKTDSSDLPNFRNYYLSAYSFQYSYSCYSCQSQVADDFEKGCLTEDQQACVSASDSSCDRDYVYEASCMANIATWNPTDGRCDDDGELHL